MTQGFEKVADADREALVDFMYAHAPIMMFPLTNLSRYGLGGDHPRAISAWVLKDGEAITDALTVSKEGMVFPCCPTEPWADATRVLRGRQLKGFVGEGQQIAALRTALGLVKPAELDETEPSYFLDLSQLKCPPTDGLVLRPLEYAPHEVMVAWRAAYEMETLNMPQDAAFARAETEIRSYAAADSHRVLFADQTPVAMTGFNAALPEIVQVGGVYTPPDLRGRGYARAALALHLTEVAVDGVSQAVLSAANASAARAYIALGFEQTGQFALVIYDEPQMAHG